MDVHEPSERGRGQVGVITGGGSGIGAEIGRWLARQHTDVVLADVDESNAESVASEINEKGRGRAKGIFTDVTDEASVDDLVGWVKEKKGQIDYLFANAGLAGPVKLEDTSYDDWKQVIDVNLNGVYLVSRKFSTMLKEGDETSHIMITSSISGRKPKSIMVPYRASKAAAIMLTHCFADAMGPDVKVNVLCPGPISTPLQKDLYQRRTRDTDKTPEEMIEEEERELPLRRYPDPEDILGVLDFVLFQDGFVTGQEFNLDGGGYQNL